MGEPPEMENTLLPNDDPVLVKFISTLKKRLGENLREVWLFGSRARGDCHEYSDYDIIVVAEGQLKKIRSIVEEADFLVLDMYNELIGSIVYTPAIWNQSKHGPLGMNVMAHGRRIA